MTGGHFLFMKFPIAMRPMDSPAWAYGRPFETAKARI